jgi:hypothetical protein
MKELIKKIEDMIYDCPELYVVAREGLSNTLKKMEEINKNSEKWKPKNK